MFNNSYKIMFMLILMSGTLITVSSNSWLSAWIGLEINLLAFIPLMNDNNLMSTESSLKYFLTQALASTVFLFSVIFLLLENYCIAPMMINYSKMMILSSLLLKTGVAPFHFWFPSVMQGLSWINNLILMTWQKLAPFMLMSYLINNSIIIVSAILSALFGSIGGLNQTSLSKLMAYSSINHLSWMLMAMKNEYLWLSYFLFYSFLTFTLIMMFHIFNLSNINQLYSLSLKSKTMKFMAFFNLLSLGGLPPFMGFIPKLLIIQYLTMSNQLMIMTTLIISTLITLYFYIRLCYSSFMLASTTISWNMKINFNNQLMNIYLLCSFISIMGLIFIPFIFML